MQVKKAGKAKRPLGDIKNQAVNGSTASGQADRPAAAGVSSAHRTRVSKSILNLSGSGPQDDAAPECNQQ